MNNRTAIAVSAVLLAILAGCIGATPPEFDTTIEGPDEVATGHQVEYHVEVTDIEENNEKEVEFYVDGEKQDRELLVLYTQDDRTDERTFTHTFEEPGEYEVEFVSYDQTVETFEVTVEESPLYESVQTMQEDVSTYQMEQDGEVDVVITESGSGSTSQATATIAGDGQFDNEHERLEYHFEFDIDSPLFADSSEERWWYVDDTMYYDSTSSTSDSATTVFGSEYEDRTPPFAPLMEVFDEDDRHEADGAYVYTTDVSEGDDLELFAQAAGDELDIEMFGEETIDELVVEVTVDKETKHLDSITADISFDGEEETTGSYVEGGGDITIDFHGVNDPVDITVPSDVRAEAE